MKRDTVSVRTVGLDLNASFMVLSAQLTAKHVKTKLNVSIALEEHIETTQATANVGLKIGKMTVQHI